MPTPKLSLLLVLVAALGSTVALSGEPVAPPTTDETVHAAVIKPLLDRFNQRAMFSRARLMPPKYELKVDRALTVDAAGAGFRTFEVTRDAKADLRGCVYDGGEVYVASAEGKRERFVLASTHPRLTRVASPFGLEDDKPKPVAQKASARAGACVAAPANS
jgi:hypothetical protein